MMNKKRKIYFMGCTLALSLTACGTNSTYAPTEIPSIEVTETTETMDNIGGEPRYTEDDFKNAFDVRKIEPSWGESDDAKLYQLEQFGDTSLYMDADTLNLIIVDSGKVQYTEFPCTSPQRRLPEFLHLDLDQDGEKEMAIASTAGTGTGVYIERLAILEQDESNQYQVKEFNYEDYVKQMSDHFSYSFDKRTQQVQYMVDGKKVGGPFSIFIENPKETVGDCTFTDVGMGNFVDFYFLNGKMYIKMTLYGNIEEWPTALFYHGSMCAEIRYDKTGVFTLSNFKLTWD